MDTNWMSRQSGVDFLHALFDATEDTVVEIKVAGQAPVDAMLVDEENFRQFRSGDPAGFRFFGDQVSTSPAHLVVPRTGRWNLVVDPGLSRDTVLRATFTLLSTAHTR
jgi:hypothetical protein